MRSRKEQRNMRIAIMQVVRDAPCITTTLVAVKLDQPTFSVSGYLLAMKKSGYLDNKTLRSPKRTAWFATDKGLEWLDDDCPFAYELTNCGNIKPRALAADVEDDWVRYRSQVLTSRSLIAPSARMGVAV